MGALSGTKKKVAGDLVKYEAAQSYCRISTTIKNSEATTTAAIPDPVGYPVRLATGIYSLCQVANQANAVGLIVEGPPIPSLAAAASTTDKYSVLIRGPAVIDKAAIPTADSQAAAYTLATLVTALEGLAVPIACKDEPTKKSQQTT